MALLPTSDRTQLHARFQGEMSRVHDSLPLVKADLQAAIDAIDGWADANAAAFNLAIPLPAQTVLTARQKARLLALVVQRRYEVS